MGGGLSGPKNAQVSFQYVFDSSIAEWVAMVQPGASAASTVAGSTQVSISGNSTVVQGTNPWIIGGNSSVWQGSSAWQVQVTNQTRVSNSSALDFLATVSPAAGSTFNVRALNSSAADLQMTATPAAGSTWNTRTFCSSAADFQATVTPAAGSTFNTRTFCSSAADFNATVVLNLGALQSSAMVPAFGSSALLVRSVQPDSTYASGVAGTSGNVTVLTSAATSIYVYALTIGWSGLLTTNTKNIVLLQSAAAGTELYRATFQSGSTGAAGNFQGWNFDPYLMAVTPPAYLFRTAAGALLNLNGTSSGATYSISAWRA